jgi:3-deoxy-D-arabino-heptulosonate 7-phosphate (DAHP) synthase class II
MTIAERFDRFIAAKVRKDALERQLRDLENEMKADESFVKDWFRARPGKARYHGVAYSKTTYQRLDVKKARMILGHRAKEAEVTTDRESLALDYEAKAVRDAATSLRPLRRAEKASA